MKIDGAGAEKILGKYYNIIFYFLSLIFLGLIYIEISDPESPASWVILFPYLASFIILVSLSKHLNGSKKKKTFIIVLTVIIPWLFLLLVWLEN